MNYWEALQELYAERKRLNGVIEHLEALARGLQPPHLGRRGRKSMSAGERKLVSERMKKYWASRRQGKEK